MTDPKTLLVEDVELQIITEIYKQLQEENRNLWLGNGNLLLASQDAHKKSRRRPNRKNG